MDSQKPAQLQQHLDAIAAILYSEANPPELTAPEAIEQSVRA
ncbi:ISKra4 family transposase, partial [Arthrospira sp. PCC 8006]